jgi:hypothetical protein
MHSKEQPDSPATAATSEDFVSSLAEEEEIEHTIHDYETFAYDLPLMQDYRKEKQQKHQKDDACLLTEKVWASWLCRSLPSNVFEFFDINNEEEKAKDNDLLYELASQTSSEFADESSSDSDYILSSDSDYFFGLSTILEEDDLAILEEQEEARLRETSLLADPQLRKIVHVTTRSLRGMDLRIFFPVD